MTPHRVRLMSRLLPFSLGIIFLVIFLLINAPGPKALFLFFASAFILVSLSYLVPTLSVSLSEGNLKRLGFSSAILISASYYLFNGNTVVWLSFGWIGAICGGLGFLSSLQRVALDFLVLKQIIVSYEASLPLEIGMPLVYVVAEPGFGVYVGHRLVAKTAHALLRFRYRPGSSLLFHTTELKKGGYIHRRVARVIDKGRILAYFLLSDSLRRYSKDFRNWLIRHASCIITVRLSHEFKDDLEGVSGKEDFDDQVSEGLLLSAGPTFGLTIVASNWQNIEITERESGSISADNNLQVKWGLSAVDMGDLISPLVQKIASTAIPMTMADSRLPPRLRSLSRSLANKGIPPISDSYLRSRLAESDVERFLNLMDSIEAIIRMSVIALLVARWANKDIVLKKDISQRVLTLGTWAGLLKKVTSPNYPESQPFSELIDFWNSNILYSQSKLITNVGEIDLPFNIHQSSIVTQKDWLGWLVNFRNLTKGHGIIEEKGIAVVWEDLHEIFLDILSRLKLLFFDSTLQSLVSSGEKVALRGWMRNGRRPEGRSTMAAFSGKAGAFLKPPEGKMLSLYPFVVLKLNEVLVWDGFNSKENRLELLNYSKGQREVFSHYATGELDLFEIWKNAGVSFL